MLFFLQSFFAERFFALFDQDKSGTIDPSELMDGLHMLTKGSPVQKLKFLFDVYDSDGKRNASCHRIFYGRNRCLRKCTCTLVTQTNPM